jgi:hypothetical protein
MAKFKATVTPPRSLKSFSLFHSEMVELEKLGWHIISEKGDNVLVGEYVSRLYKIFECEGVNLADKWKELRKELENVAKIPFAAERQLGIRIEAAENQTKNPPMVKVYNFENISDNRLAKAIGSLEATIVRDFEKKCDLQWDIEYCQKSVFALFNEGHCKSCEQDIQQFIKVSQRLQKCWNKQQTLSLVLHKRGKNKCQTPAC